MSSGLQDIGQFKLALIWLRLQADSRIVEYNDKRYPFMVISAAVVVSFSTKS